MAAASRNRFSLPIFRTKNRSLKTVFDGRLAQLFTPKDYSSSSSSSSSSSTEIPLLQKLLKAPVSRIKATLDSEFSSENLPWPALLSSLNASAPHKATLVVEWKLEKLTKENVKDQDSYTQLISLCENIRNLPTAMLTFTSMEAQGFKPTSTLFNSLISTSLSSSNLLTALSLFEIMEHSESYKPNPDTYNAFISTYANSGNKTATESWFSAKQASGFPSNTQTYGFLILSCIKSRNFEDAERYYKEMMVSRLMPNESIFQNMILMYCQQRNSRKVKEFLKLLLDYMWRIDRNIAKKVVTLYRELGLVEEMEEVLAILTKSRQTIEVLSIVYSSIIRMYADKDRLDDVEYSVGRMLKDGISFSCSEDVEKAICSYFRKEAYDKLDLFLECIKDSYKLTRSIYDLLGAGYRRAGLSEKVKLLVNEMKLGGFA